MNRNVLSAIVLVGVASLMTWSARDASGQARKAPSTSEAQKSAGKSKQAKPSKADQERARAIEEQLRSNAREVLLAGFEQLKADDVASALAEPAAVARLSRGLPPDLAIAALKGVAAVGLASSSAAVSPYLRHRDPSVRRAAARALAKTGGPVAAEGLRGALSDPDPQVRGHAATGIGAIGAGQLIDDLFVAMDHKVVEAAASIGQLCNPAQCERFAAKTGQFSFDVMTSGFDQILFRDPAAVSDDLKLNIVGRIRETGTAEAHVFLKDVQSRWPASWSKRVKQAVDLAVSSTEGAPGARRDSSEGAP